MIEIKYLDINEFENEYYDELLKDEALNQLILGDLTLTKNSIEKGIEINPNNRFGVILKNNQVLFFVCNFLPFNMVVTPNGNINKEDIIDCAKALALNLKDNNIEISGIQSIKDFCDEFINTYDKEFEISLSMDIMICQKVNDYSLRGKLRRASKEERDELIKMIHAFYKDALNEDKDEEDINNQCDLLLTNPDYYIWVYEIDNKIIGISGSTRKLPHGRSLSYVYIKDEYRLKGYCKEMIAATTDYYLKNGNDYVVLYVDKNNPYSNGAYQAVGYEYSYAIYSYNLKKSITE